MRFFTSVRATAAALAACLLAACATGPGAPPEVLVKERALARWNALIASKLEDSYKLHAPSYRAVISFERYRATIGGSMQWTGAEVIKVECEAEKCAVRLKIDANSPVPMRFKGTLSTGVDETWLLEDGQWWLFQRL
jgi:hypothetical protein